MGAKSKDCWMPGTQGVWRPPGSCPSLGSRAFVMSGAWVLDSRKTVPAQDSDQQGQQGRDSWPFASSSRRWGLLESGTLYK